MVRAEDACTSSNATADLTDLLLLLLQAEPVGLVVPASAASNLSTVAVHGSASAGSPQAMAAR
jgi:hypothetical protein